MKAKIFTAFVALFTIFTIQGCANLDYINTFSVTASKTVESYNDIGYTNTSSYYDYTAYSKIYDFDKKELDSNNVHLPKPLIPPGEPSRAMDADKAINLFVTGISSYFEALGKLSDKNLINYNFDEVADSLKANTTVKSALKISDNQITAVSVLSKVLTNEIMGAYRIHNIKRVMIEYDGQLATSIDGLTTALTYMVSRIDADRSKTQLKYRQVLANPRLELAGKPPLMNQYIAEVSKLDKLKLQFQLLIKALEKVKEDHHKAVKDLQDPSIDGKKVISNIEKYAGEIYQVYSNVKALK